MKKEEKMKRLRERAEKISKQVERLNSQIRKKKFALGKCVSEYNKLARKSQLSLMSLNEQDIVLFD